MTAFALPNFRRRKSKPQQAAEAAVKVWTAMKIGSVVTTTAKKGAKTYAKFKVVKFVGRHGKKLIFIPIAAGGGVAAYKKLSSSSDEPATPYGSSVGPAATPSTVTPPKTAPGSTANGEGTLSDSPAGTANPPSPPGSAS